MELCITCDAPETTSSTWPSVVTYRVGDTENGVATPLNDATVTRVAGESMRADGAILPWDAANGRSAQQTDDNHGGRCTNHERMGTDVR